MNDGLYGVLKGKAYKFAAVVTGASHHDAKAAGYRDLWDLLMSDSDHPRQAMFLLMLNSGLSEKQRKILLDGLAREYAGLDGWMEYVEQETT